MRTVNLNNASPYSEATLNVAPWYLRVCGDQYSERELTKDQILARDVVEVASGLGRRASMYDYLKGHRSFPMREIAVTDPRLHRFIRKDLNPEHTCRIAWDMFAHFAAVLPLRYVKALMYDEMKSKDRANKLIDHILCAMSVFPLKTVFKSYAIMGLYAYHEFEPQLCTAFESGSPVPMASAFSSLARNCINKKTRFELLAAAMMIASGDGFMNAARQEKDDPMMQRSLVRCSLGSFGLATLFSLSVREDAHCYSPVILDSLQRYAGYMQGSIARWQESNK